MDSLIIINGMQSSPPAPKITAGNPLVHACTKYYFLALKKEFGGLSNFTCMTFLKTKIDTMFLIYF